MENEIGAETNTTVTVNDLATSRYEKYWHRGLGVTNDSSAVYQEVNVVGVYNPPGTNDPDIVSTSSGHVFVAKTPEAFTYDDDGNLLSDGRFDYSWDAENRLIAVETSTNLVGTAVPAVRNADAVVCAQAPRITVPPGRDSGNCC